MGPTCGSSIRQMKPESKLARQKKAARKVAEIMYASLQKFPREEQEERIRAIQKIAIKRKTNGKTPKRASTPENSPIGSLPAVRQRKRGRP
jgi:hypothetical protein